MRCQPLKCTRKAKRSIVFFAAFLLPQIILAQDAPPQYGSSPAVIRSSSTLVTVPVLVRSPSDEFVKNLDAGNFRLWDNGIQQKVSFEETGNQPIAVMVLIQTGGLGYLQFKNYHNLPLLLHAIIGASIHELMLMTFDSRPEEIWHFPIRSDGLDYALAHPRAGDGGVAIMDAVNDAVAQFQHEPGDFQRVIFLMSQTNDD